jgi:hypothetical protein
MCTGIHFVCMHVKFMPLIFLVGIWKTYYLWHQICGGVTARLQLGLSAFLFFCELWNLLCLLPSVCLVFGFCMHWCIWRVIFQLSHKSKLCKNIIRITNLYKPYLLHNDDGWSYFVPLLWFLVKSSFINPNECTRCKHKKKIMAFHHFYMCWHVGANLREFVHQI